MDGQTNPIADSNLTTMALAAVLLGFSSATQDVVIDAYRIESADVDLQAMMSATYIAGYRIGMLVAGAGALFLASYFGSAKESYNYEAWQMSYTLMAAVMSIGIMTTLLISEPIIAKDIHISHYTSQDYLRFLLLFIVVVAGFIGSFYLNSDFANTSKLALSEMLQIKILPVF